jgi:hypothetical protein
VNPPAQFPSRSGRFEIRTPNRDFRGVRHNVQFFEGVGHTDSPSDAAACGELGYAVTDLSAPPPATGTDAATAADNAEKGQG